MTLRMRGAAERLAGDDYGVALRRVHAAFDTTDHRLGKLRTGLRLCLLRTTRPARTGAAFGAGRIVRVVTTQRLHQPLADEEQKDQQEYLSHGDAQTTARCNSTSNTKRLPTYASNSATNEASTQRNAARPRQPETLRAVSSAPNMSHDRIANTVL